MTPIKHYRSKKFDNYVGYLITIGMGKDVQEASQIASIILGDKVNNSTKDKTKKYCKKFK